MDEEKIRFSEIGIGEIHTRRVRPSGTGAVINFLKKHIGKKVFVVVPKTSSEQDKEQASKGNSESPFGNSGVIRANLVVKQRGNMV